jgi:hypothetical protein
MISLYPAMWIARHGFLDRKLFLDLGVSNIIFAEPSQQKAPAITPQGLLL